MFYDKFIELCNKKKVLPAKVATECGFNRASITNWKNNGYTPRRDILMKLAAYFDVSVDSLLDETDQKKKPSANNDEGQQNSFVRSLTQHEQLVILAYRIAKPEAREIIDNILRIQPEEVESPSRTGTA